MSKKEPDKNNKILSKNILENIKSKLTLKTIFKYLDKKLMFLIINYNKNIQSRLGFSLKSYKYFYETIEIELKPAKDKFGEFINIDKAEKLEYYHIYFNDNTTEINRNYLNQNEKVKKINIIIDVEVKSLKELFLFCEYIESITFKRFYRKDIINMSGMFSGCKSLKKINFYKFNTDNVTNMKFMFWECESLIKLDLSNFNTLNVTNMRFMFNKYTSLKYLNISNFNTSKVTDMSYKFNNCTALNQINVSNFNVSNVVYMVSMFSGCSRKLKTKIKTQNKNIRDGAYFNE